MQGAKCFTYCVINSKDKFYQVHEMKPKYKNVLQFLGKPSKYVLTDDLLISIYLIIFNTQLILNYDDTICNYGVDELK
uniref:CSON012596 protein n=1 Tax=Culicoides sonorensis TaxID=179676 RepID=A0A336KMF5_CULSO